MKRYIIRDDLSRAIYEYLMSRPMGEVEGMVLGLRSLPTYVEVTDRPIDKPDTNPSSKE